MRARSPVERAAANARHPWPHLRPLRSAPPSIKPARPLAAALPFLSSAVAECCPGGAVCPGHTCAKCECADCGLAGHAKDYNAASLLTKCPGPLGTFCQPNLCVGGTAMCCPDTGKVCPGTTCTSVRARERPRSRSDLSLSRA